MGDSSKASGRRGGFQRGGNEKGAEGASAGVEGGFSNGGGMALWRDSSGHDGQGGAVNEGAGLGIAGVPYDAAELDGAGGPDAADLALGPVGEGTDPLVSGQGIPAGTPMGDEEEPVHEDGHEGDEEGF